MKEKFLELLKDSFINERNTSHVVIKVTNRMASDNLKNYLEQFGFSMAGDLSGGYLTMSLSTGSFNVFPPTKSFPANCKIFDSVGQFIGYGVHCQIAEELLPKPKKLSSREEAFWDRMQKSLPTPNKEGEGQRISIALRSHKLKEDLQSILESFGLRGAHLKNKGTCYINVDGKNIYSVRSEVSKYQTVKEFSGVHGFKQFLVNNGFFVDQVSNDSNGSYKIDFKALWENPEENLKHKNNDKDVEIRKGRVPNIQTKTAIVTRGAGREGRKVCCKARKAILTRGHCSY